MDYDAFLQQRSQDNTWHGFDPTALPGFLFDFQAHLVTWALRKGRAAHLVDCGLGKTPMQLVWADQVAQHTGKPVLVVTAIAVGHQTVREGDKFGLTTRISREGAAYAPITITNYERLHYFTPDDFGGIVCDESGCLKHFTGATQQAVTVFARKIPYRLMATATAAPNDYAELGTQSEALGALGYRDMLTRFFTRGDKITSRLVQKGAAHEAVQADRHEWRMKPHATTPFWQWVASWARAMRKPSDLGYADDDFQLPALHEHPHVITPHSTPEGWLIHREAIGHQEELEERRRTIPDRCAYVAELVQHTQPAVIWCHLNDEGDLLERMVPGARQVHGRTTEEEKEATFRAFADGSLRALILKPKIGAWGLNWQHCAHVVTFATHSYEQYYQAVRRCWRFGQRRPVTVDIVLTKGEQRIQANMARKSDAASAMFTALIAQMQHATAIARTATTRHTVEAPAWLRPS